MFDRLSSAIFKCSQTNSSECYMYETTVTTMYKRNYVVKEVDTRLILQLNQ